MFHREAIKRFLFPFCIHSITLQQRYVLLDSNFGFHSFDMGEKKKKNHVPGQREKHGTLGRLREKSRETPGLHKIVLVYIKEFVFPLFLLPLVLKTQANP